MTIPWSALCCALLAGCPARDMQRVTAMEGRYELGEPPAAWRPLDPGGADHAWRQPGLGATIYLDSNCGRRFEDSPLERLADELVSALDRPEEAGRQAGMVDGRAALFVGATGLLDGVEVRLGATVFKKDSCTYDVVLVAPPGSFDDALPDFQALVRSFHAGAP